MNEEFSHIGTVRRRPRSGNQRSQNPGNNNGKASGGAAGKANANGNGSTRNGNGSYGPNRRDPDARRGEFERETYYDRRDERESERESRRGYEREREFNRDRGAEKKEKKTLPNYGPELDEEPLFKVPFDPWRLYGAAKRNIGWILCAGALLGLAGFFFAAYMVDYKIPVQLIRKTSNAVRSDNMMALDFMPREYSEQTLFSFMVASPVRERVAAKAQEDPALASLNVTPRKLAESISVKPTPNPDIVLLNMEAFGPLEPMVSLANLYAKEVQTYLREVQRTEAGVISKYLQGQLAVAGTNLARLTDELGKFSESGFLPLDKETQNAIQQLVQMKAEVQALRREGAEVEERLKVMGGGITGGMTKLDVARQQLKEMRVNMTDKHSAVQQKIREIERLEQMSDGGGPAVTITPGNANDALLLDRLQLQGKKPAIERSLASLTNQIAELQQRLGSQSDSRIQFELKKGELDSLGKAMSVLTERQRQAQAFYDNSLGYFNVHSEASLGSINKKARWMKVSVLASFAGCMGLLAALAVVMLTEMMDTTLRTPEDISRVTKLPVLASLGDLRKMSAQQQVNWAFRTLTLLRGKLSRDADQALVCGIISANHGEGRSTWVNLLVSAANQRGLRVLTVDTRSTAVPTEPVAPKPPAPAQAKAPMATAESKAAEATNGQPINLPDKPDDTLNSNVLSTPARVAEQLQSPNSQPLVHIPLPGWVWNLERRKQWERALEYWKDIDNLVIFVELPPASEQESVLLAEHLPQCLWLTGSGLADAAETAAHVETLRHARCNLVGAVLNYAPPPFLSNKITRWFARSTTALMLAASLSSGFAADEPAAVAAAAETQLAAAQPQENLTFGATKRKRAQWQERLTFGPGDVIDVHFYGNSALSRTNIFIGPDGRINYLQATVVAAGTTVEELRQKLDTVLSEYYPTIKTIVVPVAYNSKKYFMLGKVNAKGAYPLDRPLTLLEAVARAKGLETGLYQRTTVEMADLGRSFVVRGNEKLPVDFEKLFLEGDLTQNIAIEPNDYVFFASTGANDIYVLGEVMNPGPLGFVQSATVLTAIADRGGYSDRAFKKRVLVIRGSLEEPETFVVDSGSALEAAKKDFRLQPRDIVYVSRRPWVKAEELLDEAASSFIQGMVTTWAGVNVGPIITKRLLPRARNQ
jgi:protein involved in polysaccharide export with SLBB domain